MKKLMLPILLIVISMAGIVLYFPQLSHQDPMIEVKKELESEEMVSEMQKGFEYPIEASFEINTNGIKRSFTAAMYKNQSEAAFIPSNNASAVIVNEEGTTWQSFFNTLPFSLDKECLVTGDGEKLCNSQNKNLLFILNNNIEPNALDMIIMPGDNLVVRYE